MKMVQEHLKKYVAKECSGRIHSSLLKCEKIKLYKSDKLYGIRRNLLFEY